MKRKSIKLVATSLLLSSLLSFSSLAAWEQQADGGWKYKDDATQQYITATWIESASEAGLWYYVDQNGIMATNKLIDDLYYVNDLGEWREGQTDGSNQGNTNSWSAEINFDDWDQGGGGLGGWSDEELALWEEALNKVR